MTTNSLKNILVVLLATALCLSAQVTGNTPKKTKVSKETEIKTLTAAAATEKDPEKKLVLARAAKILAEQLEAEAKKASGKSDSPAMVTARRQIAGEQKRISQRNKKAEEVIGNAQMVGCSDITTNTEAFLNPTSVDGSTVIVSPAGTRTSRVHVMVSVRILNIGTFAIDSIESPLSRYGVLVRNLCSGGAITLSFTLNWEDPDYLTIPLLATARTSDGRVATEEMTLSLSRYNQQYNRIDARNWRVRLQPEHQVR